jgi:hypothetical protein
MPPYPHNMLDLSCRDTFASLAAHQLAKGLTLLSKALETEGFDPSLDIVLWPEFSVTRNRGRWHDGFAYGTFIAWPRTSIPFVPVSVRPNACGSLVALTAQRSADEIANIIKSCDFLPTLDDPQLLFSRHDLSSGNHFFSFGRCKDFSDKTVLVVHTCPSLPKVASQSRLGLYPHPDSKLASISAEVTSGDTTLKYLVGDNAAAYLREFDKANSVACVARRKLAVALCGDEINVIFNECHQGVGANYVNLGCTAGPVTGLIMGNDAGAPCLLIHHGLTIGEVFRRAGHPLHTEDIESMHVYPHGLGIRWTLDGSFHATRQTPNGPVIELQTNVGANHLYAAPDLIRHTYRDSSIAAASLGTLLPNLVQEIESNVMCRI